MKETLQLKHGRKTINLDSQIFLPKYHRYQRLHEAFNGSTEEERAPKEMTDEEIHQRVNHLRANYGKGKQKIAKKNV